MPGFREQLIFNVCQVLITAVEGGKKPKTERREVIVVREGLQKGHSGILDLLALNSFQIKLAQRKVKMISPPPAAAAGSASDLGHSACVVPAFCILNQQ